MIVETDVEGAPLATNVFRSEEAPVPAILSLSPYGKDIHWADNAPLHAGIELGPHAVWETPDPAWWVPRGYGIVRADSRGTGASPGAFDPLSPQDQRDYHDLIEWVGTRPWCTGKVGLLGVSYYAILQWLVAARRPAHLAAIVPWEGMNDLYREWAHQGGILANGFTNMWWQGHFGEEGRLAGPPAIDWREEFRRRPFDDVWYQERSAELELIDVPLLSAANWGAFHLHLRGNVEGFVRAGSRHKRLVVHTGTHIDPFYSEWGKAEQLRFFDRWLKDEPNGSEHDPPVRLSIRRGRETVWRDEQEWPLARTRWTRLYLDGAVHGLDWAPSRPAVAIYTAPMEAVAFETREVGDDLELTGPAVLRLWVSADADDMDVFVALRDIDPDGVEVPGIGPRGGPVPMAAGWLRASHRELDEERSLPYRPFHAHRRRLPLPAEPFALDVEVWPTSMVLAPGHRLRLEISASDVATAGLTHDDSDDRPAVRFAGENRIHTGGPYDSHLLLPVIGDIPGWHGDLRPVEPPAPFARGCIHTVFRDGAWLTEMEGYGELRRHLHRQAAIADGRVQAEQYGVEHVIHEEDR